MAPSDTGAVEMVAESQQQPHGHTAPDPDQKQQEEQAQHETGLEQTTQEAYARPPARRLLILVKTRHANAAADAWDNPDALLDRAVSYLQRTSLPTLTREDCRLMAVERWNPYTFVVCDLFHDDYDFDTAHLDDKRNKLPVVVLRSRHSDNHPFKQDPGAPGGLLENLVNKSLQEAHELHGWRLHPPFKIDHKDGMCPAYYAPRALGRDRTSWPAVDVTYSRYPGREDEQRFDQ
ncbi:hypothetical protein SPBR_06184 [Sporothrix brasiliensis 5110]|uniref:Uncharacterized protein n=1 Tax=Sporothrix brasiliensis 5110 TaxID=1398154 RepID=A0A0C2J4U9_9PEZI|nr:uncharacterized protein SPBR_06184 [Sporothrix brasiliensis 5110]KIH94050.1 hypothetical protein SPBR_06184 [Sporothrix brasiliensis 5110]